MFLRLRSNHGEINQGDVSPQADSMIGGAPRGTGAICFERAGRLRTGEKRAKRMPWPE